MEGVSCTAVAGPILAASQTPKHSPSSKSCPSRRAEDRRQAYDHGARWKAASAPRRVGAGIVHVIYVKRDAGPEKLTDEGILGLKYSITHFYNLTSYTVQMVSSPSSFQDQNPLDQGLEHPKASKESVAVRADSLEAEVDETAHVFARVWPNITDDNALTLFGFRRFRTAHLLNIRMLENEITEANRKVMTAGAALGIPLPARNKLGLGYGTRRAAWELNPVMDHAFMANLRRLLKEYDEALIAFNQLMMMETFALADSGWLGKYHEKQSEYEAYKTRLVRVDLLARRGSKDLIEHGLRYILRAFWFFVRSGGRRNNPTAEPPVQEPEDGGARRRDKLDEELRAAYQNTTMIAEFSAKFIFALIAGSSLVIPLIFLTAQQSQSAHMATIVVFIIIISLVLSLLSKASNQEIMAASAAYAAVLVVFISNSPGKA
ncbi:hypothetical protein PWT90_04448 [Aphanocladium album]|nr:hypothetical protein PWT90_04448 [Aphanocladium album]